MLFRSSVTQHSSFTYYLYLSPFDELFLLLLTGDILSTIVDMHKSKELEDAFIVPVSISYEKLPEQDMVERAQMEATQCQGAGILSLTKLLGSSLGFVRVDLSQPIRLKVRNSNCIPDSSMRKSSSCQFSCIG